MATNSDNIFLDNKTRLNNSTRLVLKYWYSKCKIYYKCHKDASHYYDNLNKYMGIPTILMGIFNTTTIFTNYSVQNQNLALITGSASFVATILSTLQNYYDLGKLANNHAKQAAGYSKVVNVIEKILMYEKLTNNNEISSKIIDNIMNQMEFLQQDAPVIPSSIWNKYKNDLKKIISSIINCDTIVNDIISISSNNSTDDKKRIIPPNELDTPERNEGKNDERNAIEIIYDNNPKRTTIESP